MTMTLRKRAPGAKTTEANIAQALSEIKAQLGASYKDIEQHCGLDDSTVCKVLDASRNMHYRYVEDICHAFNLFAGKDEFTPDSVIFKYNSPDDIAALPPKLGYARFLDRHRTTPESATAQEKAEIRQLVKHRPVRTIRVEVPETILRPYTVEPMTSFKFTKDERYVVRHRGQMKVLTFPFSVNDDGEVEIIGRVLSSEEESIEAA